MNMNEWRQNEFKRLALEWIRANDTKRSLIFFKLMSTEFLWMNGTEINSKKFHHYEYEWISPEWMVNVSTDEDGAIILDWNQILVI